MLADDFNSADAKPDESERAVEVRHSIVLALLGADWPGDAADIAAHAATLCAFVLRGEVAPTHYVADMANLAESSGEALRAAFDGNGYEAMARADVPTYYAPESAPPVSVRTGKPRAGGRVNKTPQELYDVLFGGDLGAASD